MSHPYKPQARLDRDLLRHLHRRLACGSSIPTPQPGETYGAWHSRMSRDLQEVKQEQQEEWRKEHGPWHAHEVKAWLEQLQRAPSESASRYVPGNLGYSTHGASTGTPQGMPGTFGVSSNSGTSTAAERMPGTFGVTADASVYGASGGVPGSLGSYGGDQTNRTYPLDPEI